MLRVPAPVLCLVQNHKPDGSLVFFSELLNYLWICWDAGAASSRHGASRERSQTGKGKRKSLPHSELNSGNVRGGILHPAEGLEHPSGAASRSQSMEMPVVGRAGPAEQFHELCNEMDLVPDLLKSQEKVQCLG